MARYQLSVTGKLDHLIKLCQDRLSVIPTATRQPIKDYYELDMATTEMIKNIGIPAIEFVQPNKLDFKMKLILREGIGYLWGIAFTCWEDPDKQDFVQEWRELKVVLIKTTDPSSKVPARFTGVINLTLNTSYLRKGVVLDDIGLTWFSYITNMPEWATERKDVLSAGARWVDNESFGKIKDCAMRTEKEIRLADKKGPSAEKASKWDIFDTEAEKNVHFSLFDKEEGKFKTKTLAEVKGKVDTKKEVEQIKPKIDRTTKPVNLGYETRQRMPSRIDDNNEREMEDYEKTQSVHHIPMESYVQFETAVDDPRERHEQFITNMDNVADNMNRVKIGVHHGNIVPPECIGEIRSNERFRQQGAHNPGEHIVPQPSGHFKESRHREPLLNSDIPHHIGTTDPVLMPRAPLTNPAAWHDQSRPGCTPRKGKEPSP